MDIEASPDGSRTSEHEITISGKAPLNDTVRHDKKGTDPKITVDTDGDWSYDVKLKKGKNSKAGIQ